MKRMIAITIGIVLAAGVASLVIADHWEFDGTGTGSCTVEGSHIYPFAPWEGDLRYDEQGYPDAFTGFWGNDTRNKCFGTVYESSYGIWTAYQLDDGTWNYLGGDPKGSWDCIFVPSADTADGEWESNHPGCTDGTLWENLSP